MPEASRHDGRGMRPAVITGLSSVAFAIGGWVLPMRVPNLQPWVADSLLWVAAAMLVVAVFLWLWGLRKSNSPSSMPSEQGKSSSAKMGRASVLVGDVPAALEMGEDAVALLPDLDGTLPNIPGLAAGSGARSTGSGMALGRGAFSGAESSDEEDRK